MNMTFDNPLIRPLLITWQNIQLQQLHFILGQYHFWQRIGMQTILASQLFWLPNVGTPVSQFHSVTFYYYPHSLDNFDDNFYQTTLKDVLPDPVEPKHNIIPANNYCETSPEQAFLQTKKITTLENNINKQLMPKLIDLNTASEAELASLEGVSSKKAQDIILYREIISPFNTIDDLAKVKGIGQATVEKNRGKITVNPVKR